MNLFSIDWQQGWELVGWTMCYFLAIGTLIALVGAALRFAIRRTSPTVRYAWSMTVLALLSVAPIFIGAWLWPQLATPTLLPIDTPPTIDLKDLETPLSMRVIPPSPDIDYKIRQLAPPPTNTPILQDPTHEAPFATLNPEHQTLVDLTVAWLPWLWIVGTPLTFLLLTTGLIGSHRLRKHSKLLTKGPIVDACGRLRRALAVSRRVRIAISERIASPLLVGIVRPVILLPPAALTGWTPEEIEMVLLHELAHVRRWDNLVNFLQRTIESLLFFHPCVWWVSRWVRRDREECCDAIVVSQTAEPQAYAELLVALASPNPALAGLAMAQHPLTGRVRKILQLEDEKMLVSRGTISLAGLALVGLFAALLWAPTQTTVAEEATAAEVKSEPEPTSEDAEQAEDLNVEQTKKLFEVDKKNPAKRVRYEVKEQTLDQVEDFFTGLAKDPGGPRTSVEWRWIDRGKILDVTAPARAHQKVFESVFAKWTKKDSSDPPLALILRADTPQANIDAFTEQQIRLKNVFRAIKNDDGTVTVVTGKNGEPRSTITGRQIMAWTDGRLAVTDLQKNTAPPPPAVFLSLEQQRAADLAYKLLNTELHQLGTAELQRVKAMKFEGGLLVTDIKASSRMGNDPNPLQEGDLLVGLHVWPTTSLADVKQVLQRDDLAELSPLKFYAIRQTQRVGGAYGMPSPGPQQVKTIDELVTGRITVNVAAIKHKSSARRFDAAPLNELVLQPSDTIKIVATGVYPDQPIDDTYVIGPDGMINLGPVYGRINVAGITLEEAEKILQRELSQILENARFQISLYESKRRQAKKRQPIKSSDFRQPRPTETTLDEWGEPIKESSVDQSPTPAEYDQVMEEYGDLIRAVEKSYREVKAQRDRVHDEWLEQKRDGKVDQKLRDKLTTLDLRTQTLNRHRIRLKQELGLFSADQSILRAATNPQRSANPRRTLESAPLGGVATPSTQPMNSAARGWQEPDRNTKPPAQASTTDSTPPLNLRILPPGGQDRYSPVSPAQDSATTQWVSPPLAIDPLAPQPNEQSILTSSRPTQTFPLDTATSTASEHQAAPPAEQENLRSQLADEAVQQDLMLKNYRAEELAYKQQIAELRRDDAQDNSAQLRRLQAGLESLQQESLQYRLQLKEELNRRTQPLLPKSHASLEHRIQIAEIELRYAEAAYEVAKKELDIAKENNRKVEGAVTQQEIERLGLDAKRAKLQIERAEVELDALNEQAKPKREEQPTLLYDDKTFDQWRSLWKNELKTEKRIEAIKALAAFGRTGYGKEAAEVIFEVAEQYQFEKEGEAEGELFRSIVNALSRSIPADVWFPMLKERFDVEPRRWMELAARAVPEIRDAKLRDAQIDLLIAIAHAEPAPHRRSAIQALVQLDKKLANKNIAGMFEEFFYSDEPRKQHDALNALGKAHQIEPSLVSLTLAGPREIQVVLRRMLRSTSGRAGAEKLIADVSSMLKVEYLGIERHLTLLRSLAAIGKGAESAIPVIEPFLDHENHKLRVAAAVALERISSGSSQAVEVLEGKLKGSDGKDPTTEDIEKLIAEERTALFGEGYTEEQAGGGFF